MISVLSFCCANVRFSNVSMDSYLVHIISCCMNLLKKYLISIIKFSVEFQKLNQYTNKKYKNIRFPVVLDNRHNCFTQ